MSPFHEYTIREPSVVPLGAGVAVAAVGAAPDEPFGGSVGGDDHGRDPVAAASRDPPRIRERCAQRGSLEPIGIVERSG